MMSAFLKVLLQFALYAKDPHWSCEVTHRDPGVPATFFLYCAQTTPDGLEVVSVGAYVPDAPRAAKVVTTTARTEP